MKSTNTLMMGVAVLAFAGLAVAQVPEFQYTVQTWGSYTQFDQAKANTGDETTTQLGFGLRRLFLRGKMTVGDLTTFVQYSATDNKVLDARLDYKLSDKLTLRAGRYVGAGSQAGARTPHTAIDFIERSMVARNWGTILNRGDFRTYGVSLLGKAGQFYYEATVHNGDGGLNLRPYNTTSNNSDEDTGLAPQLDLLAGLKLKNGFHAGFHYGLPNEKRINVSHMTGFVYFEPKDYGKGDFRAKVDLASLTDKRGAVDVTSMGYAVAGFFRICDRMELGARYESWDPDTDMDKDAYGDVTVGVSYAPNPDKWAENLFKLAATFKTHQGDNRPYDPLTVYVMWQVYMHK